LSFSHARPEPACPFLPAEEGMTATSLLLSVLVSAVGIGFFQYGRKQQRLVPLACGLALMIYPYFVASSALLIAIGVVLMAIPYFIQL
jgi:ABC-type Na+ efflux pump permease subunit